MKELVPKVRFFLYSAFALRAFKLFLLLAGQITESAGSRYLYDASGMSDPAL